MGSDDDDDGNLTAAAVNQPCPTCGGLTYENIAGHYYCSECGLQSQVREVHEWDKNDVYADATLTNARKKSKKTPLNLDSSEKLTLWEEYNIFLHGVVQQLLSLGANEEFQLVTLQLWTEYLRRSEAAFFDKKNAQLPKLGVRYRESDAILLYNKRKANRKKRRKSAETSDGSSITGSSVSEISYFSKKRKMRKLKQDYMQSEYNSSQYSESIKSSASGSQSIRLQFSRHARRIFKKQIPKAHMAKHEISDEILTCHRKYNNNPDAKRQLPVHLNRVQIIAIVCIALNLTQDAIQMSDVLRYIEEKRIFNGKNINEFFPDNYRFDPGANRKVDLNYITLSTRIEKTCIFLNIYDLNQSNVLELCDRYLDELCLPKILLKWIERLYISLPCIRYKNKVKSINKKQTMQTELIAMAYIIYVLKLIFGLDGHTERALSDSAMLLNQKVGKSLAFVYTEWMNYIEMRKYLIDQWKNKWHINIDRFDDLNLNNESGERKKPSKTFENKFRVLAPLRNILQECYNISTNNEEFVMNFENSVPPPSLTPQTSYLKLLIDNRKSTSILIPEFMSENHSNKNIDYLIHPKKFIRNIRKNYKINLIQEILPPQRNKFKVDPINNFIINDPIHFGGLQFDPNLIGPGGVLLYQYEFVNKSETPPKNYKKGFGPTPESWNIHDTVPNDFKANQSSDSDSDENDDDNENMEYENLSLALPHFHVWGFTLHIKLLNNLSQKMTNNVLDHGPKSFSWLIGICADLINARTRSILQYLANIEHNANHLAQQISFD